MSQTQVIVDRSRRFRGCFGIGCGTVVAGTGAFYLIGVMAGFREAFASPRDVGVVGFLFGLFLLTVALLIAVGGSVAVIRGVRSRWLGHVLGVPRLVVPAAPPLCLGSGMVAQFGRSGGSRQVNGPPRLTARLVCEESVTYREGTDSQTVTREVYQRGLAVQVDPAPGTVAGQITIEVPVGVPPSMRLSNNRIMWSVKVVVKVPGLPDDRATFDVWVQPMLAGSGLAREPGAPS